MALSKVQTEQALKILTPRELEAFQHKAAGLTRRQTAKAMSCGEQYIKNLWQLARRKLRASISPKLLNRYAGALRQAESPRRVGSMHLGDIVA